jgi:GTPase
MSGFTVAIVGRPNVGKSTFFNRLLEQRKAIVDDVSGVTRDRQYGVADWNGKSFNIIDTGGFVPASEDVFEREIGKQVMIAVEEANAMLFMVDAATGITDLDESMADVLRRTAKPVFLVVNKVDNHERLLEATEFYGLGFDNIFFISSMSGSGSGELLDALAALITEEQVAEFEDAATLPKFSIIGQPNVGKSSLLNALVGQERTIVSDIAGTTRDTIHTHYKLFQKEFILIDTAGIRRKTKVHEDLEFYSVIRAIKAMDEADVCMLVLDAVEKATNTARDYENELKKRIAPFSDVPIIFISALEKMRIHKAIEVALEVYENKQRRVATSELNEVMLKAIQSYQPPVVRGTPVRIKYVTQLPTHVPSFAFFCNLPDDVKQPYKNYLENKLREHFNFTGVPVRLFFRKK